MTLAHTHTGLNAADTSGVPCRFSIQIAEGVLFEGNGRVVINHDASEMMELAIVANTLPRAGT